MHSYPLWTRERLTSCLRPCEIQKYSSGRSSGRARSRIQIEHECSVSGQAWVLMVGTAKLGLVRLALLSCLAIAGCGLDNDVGHSGQYVFLSSSDVVDSEPYPLTHLLIVEDDAETDRAFVYLFAGELGKAGVGLPDLRRIALNYGGFQMAFDPPRARYADEKVDGRGQSLTLQVGDDASAELLRLDDAALVQTGASRWLTSVSSGDYDVRAYFALLEHVGELPALRVDDAGATVVLDPQLTTPELSVQIEDDVLSLDYGEVKGADSLRIELWQRIAQREEPHSEVEAEVRTLLPPGAAYATGRSLVTDAAGKGCWSADAELGVRLTQIARHWEPSKNGDSASVHLKLDAQWLAPEDWTALLDEPTPATYCDQYE